MNAILSKEYAGIGIEALRDIYFDMRRRLNEHIARVTEGTFKWDGKPVARADERKGLGSRDEVVEALGSLSIMLNSIDNQEDN